MRGRWLTMPVSIPLDRRILSLTDTQLEEFVREWVLKKKSEYVDAKNFSGPGDRGRDVVGYRTAAKFEGPWDNFQCKQYGRTLPTAKALADLGKVLFYAFEGEFTPPTRFFFVAPRGSARELQTYVGNPSQLKAAIINGWEKVCATKIIDNKTIELTPELRAFLESWDFSCVTLISVDEIITDPDAKPVLQSWFGIDPGPAPLGVVPDEINQIEIPYVEQLLDAYGERDGATIDRAAAKEHADHGHHFNRQRERFYDADSFTRFYRDNTMELEIEILRRDIQHGTAEVHDAKHPDSLARADAVLQQAANVQTAGALSRHAAVSVKQGLCHHFVNEGLMKWRAK